MESKLRSGKTLIVDRHSYSRVDFSSDKGLDIEWCKAPEKGLLAPDLAAYPNIPPQRNLGQPEEPGEPEEHNLGGLGKYLHRFHGFDRQSGQRIPSSGLPRPSLKAVERGGYGGERYEQLEFQKKVHQHYEMLHDPTWRVHSCIQLSRQAYFMEFLLTKGLP
ncbi:thymidylate kinase-like [Papaver somniferum]|uniref:thymidylate kinase-like n=1 Tax=Papaver somniferum TaxID=3469 RepID=UPI000E6FD342|nr:thymidylate kinase-like [Papaver somniferum]